MPIDTALRLFTVEEYERIHQTGILGEDDRVELLAGKIVRMSTIGSRHWAAVSKTTEVFVPALRGKAIVAVQSPFYLSEFSEPEPDILIARYRSDSYRDRKPDVRDILLLIEVSDTTLRFDRDVKLPLYAEAGIPEVWIADVESKVLFVFREPEDRNWKTCLTLQAVESIAPLAFPDWLVAVGEILV